KIRRSCDQFELPARSWLAATFAASSHRGSIQTRGDLNMQTLALLLQGVAGIASLVCFVMVLIQMFQHGQTGLGIACIVLIFCGVGGLIAFIYGWMKSTE